MAQDEAKKDEKSDATVQPEVANRDGAVSSAPIEPVAPHGRNPTKRWGARLARLETAWVRLETYVAVVVLIGEILALSAWIFLKGLSTPPGSSAAGVVFRAVLGATILGFVAWAATKKQKESVRSAITSGAVVVGLLLGRAWANVGVAYSSELINWYQDANSLTLIGGLRGVGTRLTLWIAMLGASLATSSGKHINIDVVMRFLPTKLRLPAALSAWSAAALVCFAATWGFVDHIAIANFGAPRDGSVGQKLAAMVHESGEHFFIVRRQFGIDMTVGPRVVFQGRKYTEALSGAEWNEKIREGGYAERYTPEQVKGLLVPETTKWVAPLVVIPGKTQRGILIDDLNLLFPFGLFVIGLKFLLRAALAWSGEIEVDPDAAHRDEHVEQAKRAQGEVA